MAKKKKKDKVQKKLEKDFIAVPGIKADGDLVAFYTKNVGKDGKWKGSKKLLKKARPACPHNTWKNKKTMSGGKNPWIKKDGRCSICGEKIKMNYYEQHKVDEAFEETGAMASQMALMNQAADGGKNTTNFIATTSLAMAKMPKLYKDLKQVCSKKDSIDKKKKGKKKKKSGEYGSWEMN